MSELSRESYTSGSSYSSLVSNDSEMSGSDEDSKTQEEDEYMIVHRDPKNSDLYKTVITREISPDILVLSKNPHSLLYQVGFEPEGIRVPEYMETFFSDIELPHSDWVINNINSYLEKEDVMTTQTFSFDAFLQKIDRLRGTQIILLSPRGRDEFELSIVEELKDGLRLSKNPEDELYKVYIHEFKNLNYLRNFLNHVNVVDRADLFIENIQKQYFHSQ